jgi:protein-disulfide isomerase/ketosteroid isomerase-like protein
MKLLKHAHREHPEDTHESSLSARLQPEVRKTLHDWRHHMANGSELAEPVDSAQDHVRGTPSAPVIVVEYGCLGSLSESVDDLALRDMLRRLLDEGRICLVFRHFPVVDAYPGAWLGAQAVEAADRQDRFWEMRDALTDSLTMPGAKELDRSAVRAAAGRLKLDIDRLAADMEHGSTAAKILRDLYGGVRSGVNGAPTFYVQGIRQDVDGPDELLERIDAALAGDLAALWPPQHTGAAHLADVARLWHEGLAADDVSASAELWDDDIAWHGWNEELPGGGTAIGRVAVEELHRRPRAGATDFRAEARQYIEHRDRVLVIGDARGETAGGGFDLPYVQIWELEAGQATRVDTLTDTLAIARAVARSEPG